jgi:hypothetical protein
VKTFDAILFPIAGGDPAIIKLKWITDMDEEDQIPWQNIEDRHWFANGSEIGTSVRSFRVFNVQGRAAPFKPDDYMIEVFYDDNALVNGSPVNQCVKQLMRGECTMPFSNNFIALRADLPRGFGEPSYRDCSLDDVPAIAQEFIEYGNRAIAA